MWELMTLLMNQLLPFLTSWRNVSTNRYLPTVANVVLQEDLTRDHLHDDKHIMKKHLGIFVGNIKTKMREVLGIHSSLRRRSYYDGNRSRDRGQQREDRPAHDYRAVPPPASYEHLLKNRTSNHVNGTPTNVEDRSYGVAPNVERTFSASSTNRLEA